MVKAYPMTADKQVKPNCKYIRFQPSSPMSEKYDVANVNDYTFDINQKPCKRLAQKRIFVGSCLFE